MHLNTSSSTTWHAVVKELFEKALKGGGKTRLPQDLALQYFVRDAELSVVCAADSEVFFPPAHTGNQVTGAAREASRSANHCIIYSPHVHVTLKIKGEAVQIHVTKVKAPAGASAI